MKILLTGANGQLGQALQTRLQHHDILAHDVQTLDITQPDAIAHTCQFFEPDIIINAAAYTAVDKAESDPEQADAINHLAVANLAKHCASTHTRMIHVSTDFVFDGSQSEPYPTSAPCHPISVYGQTKLAGEQALQQHLPDRHLIVRTAWLYSATGQNFVKTMLRLMQERNELNVVCDQIGSPTSASSLADMIARSIDMNKTQGLYHWSDAGVASWYDFAVAIFEEATAIDLLNNPVQINPIPTSAYPTPAARPRFSVLDKQAAYQDLDLPAIHWRQRLRQTIQQLADQEQ